MSCRQADIFIKMKRFYPCPVDAGSFSERIQKFDLRCRSGGNNASAAMIGKGASNSVLGLRQSENSANQSR